MPTTTIERKTGRKPQYRQRWKTVDGNEVTYHETLEEWCDRVCEAEPAWDETEVVAGLPVCEKPTASRRWMHMRYYVGAKLRTEGIMVPGNMLYSMDGAGEMKPRIFRPLLCEQDMRQLEAELDDRKRITQEENAILRQQKEDMRRDMEQHGMPVTSGGKSDKVARMAAHGESLGLSPKAIAAMITAAFAEDDEKPA